MNFQITDKVRLTAIVGGSIVVGGVLWKLLRKISREKTPKSWQRVGEVSDLLCYPIKSCGWIRMDEFDVIVIGVSTDRIRDRAFMVVDANNSFLTGRQHPKLVQISPRVEGSEMILSAPQMPEVRINLLDLEVKDVIDASVWSQPVEVVDAGDEVAEWVSKFILNQESGLRLVYYPSLVATRDVREKFKIFDTVTPKDTGALHDATSFMLVNEASIEELNTRLDAPVTPLQFRPNIVVKGAKAFDEDQWSHVKIGDVVFENIKPCTRCVFTNVNPETAEVEPNQEPLKTLKTYRKTKKCGESPVMGVHLGLRSQGKIKLGDAVYAAK